MALQQNIDQDFLTAFKSGDKFTVSVLRMLKSVIQNKKIEKGVGKEDILADDEVIAVIKSEVKKRKDSAASYHEAARVDLAENEEAEIVVLEKYMPAQLSADEIRNIVKETISTLGATSAAEFGKVMGAVVAKTKGQADGQVISTIVKEELGQ